MRFKIGAPLTVSTPAGTGVSLHCSSVFAASHRAFPSAPLHDFSAALTVSAGIGSMFILAEVAAAPPAAGLCQVALPRAALRGLPLESAAGSGQPFGAAGSCAACNGVASAARPHALQGASTGQPCVASSRVEREDGLQALCNLLGWRGGRRRET